MSHDPERNAADFMGGEMSSRAARRFEQHLLACEECWREVDQARHGRTIAESARELTPQSVRESVRATVAAAQPAPRARRIPIIAIPAAAALAVSLVVAVTSLRAPSQPPPIAAAIADFKSGRLPGSAAPTVAPPDLSTMGMSLEASGAGEIGGHPVDAYVFGDPQGHTVLLYMSAMEFPVAQGARMSHTGGPWAARIGGVEILCTSLPRSMLAVARDGEVLRHVAEILGVVDIPAS